MLHVHVYACMYACIHTRKHAYMHEHVHNHVHIEIPTLLLFLLYCIRYRHGPSERETPKTIVYYIHQKVYHLSGSGGSRPQHIEWKAVLPLD